jgi:predicted Zn-ribbon and HTH transcriptional regulator
MQQLAPVSMRRATAFGRDSVLPDVIPAPADPLMEILTQRGWSAEQLLDKLGISCAELNKALEYLSLRLGQWSAHLAIEPARCRACGAVFAPDAVPCCQAPRRCYVCRGARISPPTYRVERL